MNDEEARRAVTRQNPSDNLDAALNEAQKQSSLEDFSGETPELPETNPTEVGRPSEPAPPQPAKNPGIAPRVKGALKSEAVRIESGPRTKQGYVLPELEKMSNREIAATAGKNVVRGLSNIGFRALGGRRLVQTTTGERATLEYKIASSIDEVQELLRKGWSNPKGMGPNRWMLYRLTEITTPYQSVRTTLIEPGLLRGGKTVSIVEHTLTPAGWRPSKFETTTREIPGALNQFPGSRFGKITEPAALTQGQIARETNYVPVAREVARVRTLIPQPRPLTRQEVRRLQQARMRIQYPNPPSDSLAPDGWLLPPVGRPLRFFEVRDWLGVKQVAWQAATGRLGITRRIASYGPPLGGVGLDPRARASVFGTGYRHPPRPMSRLGVTLTPMMSESLIPRKRLWF